VSSIQPRTLYVPDSYVRYERPDLPEGCEVYYDPNQLCAIAFSGRRSKPDWHYRFQSEARLQAKVTAWASGLQEHAARLLARKAERTRPHDVKVGDIFRSSWGYDQTNIDFFECVGLKGSRQVLIRPIAAESMESAYLQGQCVPKPGVFTGEALIKNVITSESEPAVRISSYAHAYRMKPVAKVAGVNIYPTSHWTAYA